MSMAADNRFWHARMQPNRGAGVEYAVYVAVPQGDDPERIARGAHAAVSTEFEFSIRDKGDPSESVDVELCFRIGGVSHPQEAVSRALELYELGRREAGLAPDPTPEASLGA